MSGSDAEGSVADMTGRCVCVCVCMSAAMTCDDYRLSKCTNMTCFHSTWLRYRRSALLQG